MKEEYIKEVSKTLHLSRSRKKDVLRDLDEMFRSAEEAGESPERVIERLGPPHEFTENIEMQLGVDRFRHTKTKYLLVIIISAVIGIISLVLYAIIYSHRYPQNVIGQADAMTSIYIGSSYPFDISYIFLFIGIISIIISIIATVKLIRERKRK